MEKKAVDFTVSDGVRLLCCIPVGILAIGNIFLVNIWFSTNAARDFIYVIPGNLLMMFHFGWIAWYGAYPFHKRVRLNP